MSSYKVDILKAFLENKELVEAMKNCDHGNGDNVNPYHLEGSVWTHTMMVYNAADEKYPVCLMNALCHDIGKVLTRNVKEDGRVTFYGHAEASIQPSIDFALFLYNSGIIGYDDFNWFIKYGLPAIANHAIYYQNPEKALMFSNYDSIGFTFLNDLKNNDTAGSISKSDKVKDDIIFDPRREPTKFNPELPTIKIWVGLPCSGKDYLAAKEKGLIVSFDDIREETYINNVDNSDTLTRSELYSEAFKYCNDHNIDLLRILKRKVLDAVKMGYTTIHICNTSLTRKARRSLINSFGSSKFNFKVEQVFVSSNEIYKRNTQRESKFIPINVINRMMENMTVVTHFEESICEIKYTFNEEMKDKLEW